MTSVLQLLMHMHACDLLVSHKQQPGSSVQGHLKASGGVKKAKSKKGPGAKRRAKDLVDQFGCGNSKSLCCISEMSLVPRGTAPLNLTCETGSTTLQLLSSCVSSQRTEQTVLCR